MQAVKLGAQKLTLSDKEDFSLRTDDFAIIGKQGNTYAIYRRHEDVPEIYFLNQDLIKIKSVKLDFIPERYDVFFAEVVTDGILMCYQTKESKRKKVYASKMDANYKCTEPKMVLELEDAVVNDMDAIQMVSSENKQYHMLYASGLHEGSLVLRGVILDAELKQYGATNQVLSNEKGWSISHQAAVSNDGARMLLLTSKLSSKGASEELKLLMAPRDNVEFGVYPVALNKHAVSELQLCVDNTNHLFYVGGFYADGKYNSPKGLFFTTFDPALKANTISHFTGVSSQLAGANDLRDYRVRNMSIKSDGGVEFATEKYFQNVRTITSMNPTLTMGFMTVPDQTRVVNEFYYDEIVLFNLKPDGILGWSQTLLKQQQSSDDAGIYSSFGMLKNKRGNGYLFADINTKQPRLLMGYVANNSDLMIRELQTTEDMNEWNWMPRSAEQISKSEILVPCLLKNYLCFLKISY